MAEKDMFQRGFNDGYQMARFEPELLTKLLKSKASNEIEYFEGLDNGKRQFEKEQLTQKFQDGSRNASKDKGLALE